MPNFVVIDTPEVPPMGGETTAALYRVDAVDAAAAVNLVAERLKFPNERQWFVVQQNQVLRYTTTPAWSSSSVQG